MVVVGGRMVMVAVWVRSAFELVGSRPILASYYDPLTDYYSAATLSDSPYSTGNTCPFPDY